MYNILDKINDQSQLVIKNAQKVDLKQKLAILTCKNIRNTKV